LAGCLNADGLDRPKLLKEPVALQRRILRGWIARRRGSLRAVDFAHVDAMLKLIATGPSQARLALPGGWELVHEYDKLKLEKLTRTLKRNCYSYGLKVGEVLRIPEAGVELHSERVDASVDGFPADLTAAVFDLDMLPPILTVRNFRDGDRFQPLGMDGHKKVKDLFIDEKIPLSIRANLPLLVRGDEILWIPGYGRSNVARVTPATRSVIRIKAVPLGT
jgi:tRNA(Ile)-lysidine synthase